MIVVLFGQPGSGKTTLARKLKETYSSVHNIDGDFLRKLFKDENYTREGRIQNLARASDIAAYMNTVDEYDITVSMVYPYRESRSYLNSLVHRVKWVYLTYEGDRGKEKFHVPDFEVPEEIRHLHLNTSEKSISKCVASIYNYINQ